jgi:hypothetical protein
MTPDSPPLDLLVVGAITVDRFPDGSAAPGGPVLHIGRAAAPRQMRVGIVTAAGPEPEARAGLTELQQLAAFVEYEDQPVTVSFRHGESPEGRRLWLGQRGGPVGPGADTLDRMETRAVLLAPVAGEVAVEVLAAWDASLVRGAILQGWLRTLEEGEEVRPLPLAALPDAVTAALSAFDLLVASREDLLAEEGDPSEQLSAMRRAFGPRPTLVVTDGPGGVWMDVPIMGTRSEPLHLPVPRRVKGAPSVGAGDILTAFVLHGDWRRPPSLDLLRPRVASAMRVVAEVLEERLS